MNYDLYELVLSFFFGGLSVWCWVLCWAILNVEED